MSRFVIARPDLWGTPLTTPDLIFVDGSYRRNEKGDFQAGCAITAQDDLLERASLP